ncbi:UPF0481 protein At3g47200-like isoform X2 [Macadamia integrifolia]|uniref:UPF0481 protein At3g47200-like isoform X2 n=1 Tax=Macadamia integrifolia TaxID=60698 RepID=UPI001C4EDFF7|nr:UPF0481 protein At3g47200-like isoform X2 [Macadamia integrifolia]
MSSPIGDPERGLVASIRDILKIGPPSSSKFCISIVPGKLRRINKEAYTPQLVSIGPFHHKNENLRKMETLKRQFLRSFVDRKPGIDVQEYVEAMKKREEETRQCYAEDTSSINSNEFITMMLVDGCFILEFLLRNPRPLEQSNLDDPVFSNIWLSSAIKCDLILLENQLPFFVLVDLYNLNQGKGLNSLFETVRYPFSHMMPKEEDVSSENSKCSKVKQVLLGSVRDCCSSSSSSCCALPRENGGTVAVPTVKMPQVKHLLDFVRHCYIPSSAKISLVNGELKLPHNVTQLHEAGVKFEVGRGKCLLDLSFKNGVLAIPCINIEDWTESLFRNMIAFEQLHCSLPNPKFITDYATLLDGIIASSKDVILLREHGIIKSLVGDHEQGYLAYMEGKAETYLFQHAMDGNFIYCCNSAACSHIITDHIHYQILYFKVRSVALMDCSSIHHWVFSFGAGTIRFMGCGRW